MAARDAVTASAAKDAEENVNNNGPKKTIIGPKSLKITPRDPTTAVDK